MYLDHPFRYMYPACIPHVSRMSACIPNVSGMCLSCIARAFLLADVPTLKQLQGHAMEMKRAKTAAVHLEQLIDLKNLALKYFEPMPPPLSPMPPSRAHHWPHSRRTLQLFPWPAHPRAHSWRPSRRPLQFFRRSAHPRAHSWMPSRRPLQFFRRSAGAHPQHRARRSDG